MVAVSQWSGTASTTVRAGAGRSGIAMGQGSDIAIDVEKVTILSSDLTKIAAAVRLSAATVRTVRQNLSGRLSTT